MACFTRRKAAPNYFLMMLGFTLCVWISVKHLEPAAKVEPAVNDVSGVRELTEMTHSHETDAQNRNPNQTSISCEALFDGDIDTIKRASFLDNTTLR